MKVKTLADDFDVYNGGSIILFHPLTKAAENWWTDNVDPECLMMGASYAVEARFAGDIMDGLNNEKIHS